MEKIGRYELVGELGAGAMGVVYRAVDPNIGRTVALKTMRLDVHDLEHDEMLLRFRNEARAAGLMNHPNIVTIHDADECDGLFFIAMEYIEGETLQSLIARKHHLSSDRIVEIATQVANGVDYAHAMKIVHRDIKPENIMITKQNVAKIMDFGISKKVDTKTRTGQVLGTPHYMSPEQVTGGDLDGRSDLFSFGVVLYEMATGERPFDGENVATIIYKIVHENPPSPREVEMAVHPGLSAVITRCLAKDRNDRYQTGSQLSADLKNFRSVQPLDEQPTSVISLPGETSRDSIGKTPLLHATKSGSAGTPTIRKEKTLATTINRATASAKAERPASPAGQSARGRNIALIAVAMVLLAFSAVMRLSQQHRKASEAQSALQAHIPELTSPAAQPTTALEQPTPGPMVATADNSIAQSVSARAIPEKGTRSPVERKVVAVHLTSNPEGAAVQFDGRSNPLWITPCTIANVVPGKHTVVIAKSGYTSEERQMEIGSGNAPYTFELQPETMRALASADRPPPVPAQSVNTETLNAPSTDTAEEKVPNDKGLVDFVTTPPGAKIYIEGQPANRATPAHNLFPPGDYSIELRMAGYKPVQRTIHVEGGKIAPVKEILEPQ